MKTKKEITIDGHTRNLGPYDYRVVQDVVHAVESGVSRKEIIAIYGMHPETIINWMHRFGSKEYRATRTRRFSSSEKRSVIRAVASGMSVKEAQTVFGIKCRSVINNWIRVSKAENADFGINIPLVKPKKQKQTDHDLEALEQALAEAQLKIQALETMIDIAQEQLKIDIRKKSGAKQSPK